MWRPQTGDKVHAELELLEPLAVGGMSVLWVAQHLGLGRRVAVKFLSPALVEKEPSLVQRMRREAQISERLASPHAVQVFEHGMTEDGAAFLVMELLDGVELARSVAEAGPLGLPNVVALVRQAAVALERAHELGIVHRDVAPRNVFLLSVDTELFVKLLDFGVAKLTGPSENNSCVTHVGSVIGTLGFMSPEQVLALPDIDARADVFGLGVVAYFALTGEAPFQMNDDLPLFMQWAAGPMPLQYAAPELQPELARALDGWFARSLATHRAERFQTIRELCLALDEVFAVT